MHTLEPSLASSIIPVYLILSYKAVKPHPAIPLHITRVYPKELAQSTPAPIISISSSFEQVYI